MSKMIKQTGFLVNDDVFVPTVQTIQPDMPAGFYEACHDLNYGFHFKKLSLNDQNLIKFPDTVSDTVINDIRSFWTREALFNKYKFPYKRGILMYGPPGCGKSCSIGILSRDVIEQGGLVVRFSYYEHLIGCMKTFRKIQPETPVVVLMEDLDEILNNSSISQILNLLDGVEVAMSKVVYLATTNCPEKLHNNIKNRPSRFDRRFEFGPPSPAARKVYFESLFEGDDLGLDLDQWVSETEGFSFAHMKELFVSTVILGNSFVDAVKELKGMQDIGAGEVEMEEALYNDSPSKVAQSIIEKLSDGSIDEEAAIDELAILDKAMGNDDCFEFPCDTVPNSRK